MMYQIGSSQSCLQMIQTFSTREKLWMEVKMQMNCELAKVDEWFKANLLSLNVGKTSYILFGNKKTPRYKDLYAKLLSDSPVPHQIPWRDSII